MVRQRLLKRIVLVASVLGAAFAIRAMPAIAGDSAEDNVRPVCEASSGASVTCVYAQKNPAPETYKYFTGEVRGGLPNGSGVLVYSNGDRYEGTVRNGAPNGRGMFLFATDDRYEGDMKNGQPHGRGSFVFTNGDRYTGDVRYGHPHGQGTFVYNNGNVYSGGFYLGQAKGNGTISFKSGIRCQGVFYNSSLEGKGTCSFPPGFPFVSYTGELRQGVGDGRGTLVYSDGRKFSGEIRKGAPYTP